MDRGPTVTRPVAPRAQALLAAPADERHIVQFYEDESYLAEVIAGYVAAGLARGEPALVVAEPGHAAAFGERLGHSGVDVARARAERRLVVLDARQTIARITTGGLPDTTRFLDVVGGALGELARDNGGARVRAYGEMVDVLWSDGETDAALALEELWNALGQTQSFSLLCAYALSRFAKSGDGDGILRVCAAHSHVLPAESYTRIADDEARLRQVAQLQQRARALESEIVERKAMEEELRALLRQRDHFLAIAGHELKTPLTAAQLMMESILRLSDGVPAELRERLVKATRNLERLGRLVESIVDVTRLTRGPMALHREELDLVALVRDVVDDAVPMLQSARCAVHVDGQPSVYGRWDRQRLEQVIRHLLSNACKYAAGQAIDVGVDGADGRARLTVRDRGIGIARDDHARIFERFERANPTPQAWGLGLGLWVARQAVEAHGGTIAVASDLGEGATFTVELPLG